MPARGCVVVLAAALLWPAASRAASPFDAVMRQIGAALHAQPEHAKALGLVGWFARRVHPHEAAGLHLALFTAPPGLNLAATAGPALGPDWSRLVSTVERRAHKQDLVYVRAEDRGFDLLILSLDHDNQLAVVTLRVKADQLFDQVEQHSR